VTAPGVPPVLLLSSTLISGGRWVYEYSVAPGRVVSLVTMPGPGMLPPDDPSWAVAVDQLLRSNR
jgi:hypothetical protein